MPKEIYLIDGNSYAYRAFYALGKLTTSQGKPIGAVYGFYNMLFSLISEKRPEYLSIVFDHPSPTFRHKKFEEYKIHRRPMPEDLKGQIALIKDIAVTMDISVMEQAGFEADDILATLAKKFEKDFMIFVVTGDKDILQLINSKIKVIDTHKDNLVYDEEKVKERYGFKPVQIVDFIALAGDATDNIPGVRGIGSKTAVELLQEFGTLENIYRNLDKVKGEAKQKILRENYDQANISRELALLNCRVPMEVNPEDLRWVKFDREKIKAIFRDLEFNRLIKRLDELPLVCT